jgi:hypothetical protein
MFYFVILIYQAILMLPHEINLVIKLSRALIMKAPITANNSNCFKKLTGLILSIRLCLTWRNKIYSIYCKKKIFDDVLAEMSIKSLLQLTVSKTEKATLVNPVF